MYTFYTNNLGMPMRYVHKLLFIMRLTTVLMIVSMLQVSASGFGQRLNYVRKQVTLLELFKEIKVQTGYNVVWSEQDVNTTTYIKANFKNTLISEVLDQSLKGLNLSYVINNKTIIIKETASSILDKTKSVIQQIFQNINVRGYVVDDQNSPLRGATVKIKGSNRLTTTNEQGVFSLANVPEQSILVISYLGYQTQEIKARADIVVVKLLLSTDKLEEVEINAGYYKVKDRERTGSISRITAKDIESQPVNNPLMALVGNVPGLQVSQSSGVPGGGFTVRIRGQNSIGSGNDPLYIVDGVNYPSAGISSTSVGGINNILGVGGANPLSLINANDIESIEVLKDADATAIYGSRGSNGIILITTKKGKLGVSRVDASVSQGFSNVGHKVGLLNTEQYLQMRREAYFKNDMLTSTSPSYATQYDINGSWDENKYTDWQDELIGGTAALTNASISLSGGTSKNNYRIGGNYSSEGTVVPGNFGVKRFGLLSNVNLGALEDLFHAALTININNMQSDLYSNSLMGYLFLPPNQPDPYDSYGQFNWSEGTVVTNPYANLLNTSNTKTNNLISNLILSYKILNNLTIKSSIGFSSVNRKEFRKAPLAAWAPSYGFTSTIRQSFFGNNYNNNFIAEPQLNYNIKLSRSKIDALIGASIQENNSQINVVKAANFTSDDLLENIASAASLTNDQNEFVQYRYVAAFGRLNYSLEDKYFVNLTGRRDGSSRFGSGKQFANFGAIGIGWIFSGENIVKDILPIISFGKLRGSYGITGNDQILNYQYLQLWNSGTVYQGNPTLSPSTTAKNPLFSWETNRKSEAALELGFFQDRINIEISWFRNRSSNQLLFQPLPLSAGQSGTYINLPAKIQNNGWEFDSNINVFKRQGWQWSTGFNITIPKNTLIAYDELEISANSLLYKVGEPLNILKVYNANVDQQSGSYVIDDKNNNGRIDNEDRYIIKFLGQTYYGGIRSSLTYKNFNFAVLFSFAKQNGRNPLSNTVSPGSYSSGSSSNQYLDVLNRWQEPGDNGQFAKYSTTSANNTLYSPNVSQFSNRSIVDASYLRLRNVSMAYSLPQNILSPLKIKNATFQLQGQNLFTWTTYKGFDPETQGVNLPPLRTILLGLNITF